MLMLHDDSERTFFIRLSENLTVALSKYRSYACMHFTTSWHSIWPCASIRSSRKKSHFSSHRSNVIFVKNSAKNRHFFTQNGFFRPFAGRLGWYLNMFHSNASSRASAGKIVKIEFSSFPKCPLHLFIDDFWPILAYFGLFWPILADFGHPKPSRVVYGWSGAAPVWFQVIPSIFDA